MALTDAVLAITRRVSNSGAQWLFGALLGVSSLASAQLLPATIQPGQHVPAIVILVGNSGPYPQTVTQPEGPFILFVENHSSAIQDTFSLRRKDSTSIQSTAGETPLASLLDLASTETQHHDYKLINAKPGDYILTFRSHPEWAVSITIGGTK
jgi:hypothetical protein